MRIHKHKPLIIKQILSFKKYNNNDIYSVKVWTYQSLSILFVNSWNKRNFVVISKRSYIFPMTTLEILLLQIFLKSNNPGRNLNILTGLEANYWPWKMVIIKVGQKMAKLSQLS